MNIFDYTISLLSARDIWMLGTVLFCSLVMLDDIFVDVLASISNTKPHKIDEHEFKKMNHISEKKIAIMIANWHEDAVLERMVAGNINNINYTNYEILLGVYPNDQATLAAARRAEKKFSNVRVIVNMLNGPTSKGQMLNRMVNYIEEFNKFSPNNAYDLIAIHHNDYFTGGVAERIRRMSRQKDTLLVGVTGAIGPDRLETFKRGLGEHTIWDDFIVRSVDELRGTLLQLVGILESVESQRNA